MSNNLQDQLFEKISEEYRTFVKQFLSMEKEQLIYESAWIAVIGDVYNYIDGCDKMKIQKIKALLKFPNTLEEIAERRYRATEDTSDISHIIEEIYKEAKSK